MAKYKFTVEMEIDIEDHFIEQGYEVGDMIQHEFGSALNGSGIEWDEVIDVEEVKEGQSIRD